MDSITHIAVGACIGEAFAGKKIGKKAMWLGAAANSLPDIDFVFSFFMTPAQNLLAHRGITHSVFFTFLFSLLFAKAVMKWLPASGISFKQWFIFLWSQALLHLLLDSLNVYGVGWLEPFYEYRFSFNWLYVADPLFSIWPVIAFIALLILKKAKPVRMKWVKFGIVMSVIYLMYCGYNKFTADKDITTALKKQEVPYNDYFTTPTPFNTWLWYVVAQSDSGYYTGYHSVFDKDAVIKLRYNKGNHGYLAPLQNETETKQLIRFSKGFYTVKKIKDTLVFSDLRFGQIRGWNESDTAFAFYYFLGQPKANALVVQRGRFAGWDKAAIKELFKRIKGN